LKLKEKKKDGEPTDSDEEWDMQAATQAKIELQKVFKNKSTKIEPDIVYI
jgi:hypothetical protein